MKSKRKKIDLPNSVYLQDLLAVGYGKFQYNDDKEGKIKVLYDFLPFHYLFINNRSHLLLEC
jgi:hypothetical protein